MTDDRFCAYCGSPLEPDDYFCPSCGQPTSQCEKSASICYCLVLTNSILLSEELGNIKPELVMGLVNEYCRRRELASGDSYEVLDLANYGNPGLDEVVSLVRTKMERHKEIEYLFIIGSASVVPMAHYKDPTYTDKDIESDFCYSVLNSVFPRDDEPVDTSSWVKAGRLPTYKGGASALFQYLDRAAPWQPCRGPAASFSLSAQVWEKTSKTILSSFGTGEPYLCPDTGPREVAMLLPQTNALLHFNLHGSSHKESSGWYGQGRSSYPTAFEPGLLKREHGYMLACEACYGARFNGYDMRTSGLLSAMNGGCLAFLGSSRIAFGAANGKLLGADVMVSSFLLNLARGSKAGDAMMEARLALLKDKLREIELKTLLEFNLFGDPCLRFRSIQGMKDVEVKASIPVLQDVQSLVLSRLTSLSEEARAVFDQHVRRFHHEMTGVIPSLFERSDGEKLAIYEKVQRDFSNVLVLVAGADGGIIKEYVSR